MGKKSESKKKESGEKEKDGKKEVKKKKEYVFKIVVSEPKALKAIQPLKKHFDEVSIVVKGGVARVAGLDTARVALVDVLLGSGDGDGAVVVDVDKFAKAVKNVGKSEVSLSATEDKLVIKKGRVRRTLSSRIGGEEYPDIEFKGITAKIVMLASEFLKAINEVADVSDEVEFIASKDMFVIKAVGDIDEAEVVLLPDDVIEIDVGMDDVDVRSKYSADYLLSFLKSAKEVCLDTVVVEFADEMPVRISCPNARYLLAPRA